MSGEFTIDLDHLDHVVTRLDNLAVLVREHLTVLDGRVAATSWTSAAASAYLAAHREWSSAAKQFTDGIADMKAAARNAHSQYANAVTANTAMFRAG